MCRGPGCSNLGDGKDDVCAEEVEFVPEYECAACEDQEVFRGAV